MFLRNCKGCIVPYGKNIEDRAYSLKYVVHSGQEISLSNVLTLRVFQRYRCL